MNDRQKRHVVMAVRNAFTNDSRVEKEAATLRDAGYRVTVVADAGTTLPAREVVKGISIVRVPRTGPRIPGVRFVAHEIRLSRVLASLAPSVLHAHDSNTLWAVARAARGRRVPFVYDAHDLWLGRPRRGRSRVYFALNQIYYAALERLLVPRSAVTITVSPPIAEHLRKRYRLRDVRLVPNYPERDDRLEVREVGTLTGGERLDATRPVILYLGGLMEGRGLEALVDSIGLVPDAQLVLLGDGALSTELRERAARGRAAERVHILPPVPTDDVISYTASADVGVSPIVPSCLNYRYSLPNKLFQYMAAGIPVVASDFPQVREVVVGSGAGLVVDTRRPEAIASALNQILADRAAARLMGERGRAAIEERYNWSVSAAALLAAYERIAPRTIGE
jgi:glycosyltransferase involved in cell wall biosynthesis